MGREAVAVGPQRRLELGERIAHASPAERSPRVAARSASRTACGSPCRCRRTQRRGRRRSPRRSGRARAPPRTSARPCRSSAPQLAEREARRAARRRGRWRAPGRSMRRTSRPRTSAIDLAPERRARAAADERDRLEPALREALDVVVHPARVQRHALEHRARDLRAARSRARGCSRPPRTRWSSTGVRSPLSQGVKIDAAAARLGAARGAAPRAAS